MVDMRTIIWSPWLDVHTRSWCISGPVYVCIKDSSKPRLRLLPTHRIFIYFSNILHFAHHLELHALFPWAMPPTMGSVLAMSIVCALEPSLCVGILLRHMFPNGLILPD